MKKRLLSVLLSVAMCLLLIPTVAFAATYYGVWVNGVQFTSDKLTISCGGGTAQYDPTKKELTLNNATITAGNGDAGIYSKSPLTVKVAGTNAINLGSTVGDYGIYTVGDLTLTGSGSLNIQLQNLYYDGIWADKGGVTVDMSGPLTVSADDDGIAAANNVTLSGSGAVKVTSSNRSIYSYGGDVIRTGSGNLTALCESEGFAVYAAESVALSGDGTVKISSDGTGIYSFRGGVTLSLTGDTTLNCVNNGIYSGKAVTISSSGYTSVTSGGCGIYAYGHSVTLSDSGALTVTSSNDAAVKITGTDSKLLLNGTGSPITLQAGGGYSAVWNTTTESSPVWGDTFASYSVTGGPDTGKAVYLKQSDPCEGYTDIDRSSWYHSAADFVISNGLMGSTRTGVLAFEPTLPCTRGMIVTILYSYDGKPAVSYVPQFPDVQEGQWFTAPVMWAYENGVVAGYNDGSFGPTDKVTREQMAVILKAYANYVGKDVSKTADLSVFPDSGKATWSKPYLSWAVAEGLISGKLQDGKNYLDPQGLASRAEVATMIRAFVQNILEG